MDPWTYLILRGRLDARGGYQAGHGHERARPPRWATIPQDTADEPTAVTSHGSHGLGLHAPAWLQPDALRVMTLDSQGQTLATVRVLWQAMGCGATPLDLGRLRACVPLHPEATTLQITAADGHLLFKREIHPRPPDISEVEFKSSRQGLSISWSAQHPLPVWYDVLAEGADGRMCSLARRLTEARFQVAWKDLPLFGQGQVWIQAGDGLRSSRVLAGEYQAPPQTTHLILHSAAVSSDLWPHSQPLSVEAICLDRFGQPHEIEALKWLLDGHLVGHGEGRWVFESLPPGEHVIEATTLVKEDEHRARLSVRVAQETEDARWAQDLLAEHFPRAPVQ